MRHGALARITQALALEVLQLRDTGPCDDPPVNDVVERCQDDPVPRLGARNPAYHQRRSASDRDLRIDSPDILTGHNHAAAFNNFRGGGRDELFYLQPISLINTLLQSYHRGDL